MTSRPEGAELAPADNPPAFVETSEEQASSEEKSADAPEPEETKAEDEKPKRPGKNAPKPEVQAWAEALGYSSDGTVKEIFARVDEGKDETTTEDSAPVGDVDFLKIPLDRLPLASQKGDILLRVEQARSGVVVMTVSMSGMIGDVPVVFPANDSEYLKEALEDLKTQAKAVVVE